MKGKLIVIEGTDCSGKETQTKRLIAYLQEKGEKVINYSFPMYDTPTGKIIGGPFLGKEYICEGWFPEKAPNVDAKVASLYYAADRYYNIDKINSKLEEGYTVILDRYIESNMAHQGGKIEDKEKRIAMYHFIEELEFNLLGLPKPDYVIFLYMPVASAQMLRNQRKEKLDEVESDLKHLQNSEKAYLELSEIYDFIKIDCANEDDSIKTIDEIAKNVIDIYENLQIKKVRLKKKKV